MFNNIQNKSAPPTHEVLIFLIKHIYSPAGLQITDLQIEKQNLKYGAYRFKLNDMHIRFRVAKITPTKTGQFVTLWERNQEGISQPYNTSDCIDFVVICTRENNKLGQFVFPKSILQRHNILSHNGIGGKRAIRVYPPWCKVTSRLAEKTQQWQLPYFLEITESDLIKTEHLKKLYKI